MEGVVLLDIESTNCLMSDDVDMKTGETEPSTLDGT